MNHFKAGKLPFLVATDVAARGLHIDDLELIINYDLPGDCENYVHRIGRTARAGKSGKAISLACEKYVYNLEAIESFIGIKIPVGYAQDDLYLQDKAEGMIFDKPMRKTRGRGGKRPRKSLTPRRTRTSSSIETYKTRDPGRKQAKTGSKKKPHKEPADRRHPSKKKTKTTQKPTTLEDRLEYYKKKYGDNFNVQKTTGAAAGKRSLIKKIAGFFKGKR